MDDDWRIDNGLTALRARIYALLPADWAFYGPTRLRDGTWQVGCRPTRGPVEAGCVAANRDVGTAFRLLAEAIRARDLPRRLIN
jgi:hypothetical protein